MNVAAARTPGWASLDLALEAMFSVGYAEILEGGEWLAELRHFGLSGRSFGLQCPGCTSITRIGLIESWRRGLKVDLPSVGSRKVFREKI